MITLAWKKIPYLSKRLRVMTNPRQTRSPEFALITPRCKTSTFVDSDGTIVIESMAILQYLERFFPGIPENRLSELSKSEWTQETVRYHEFLKTLTEYTSLPNCYTMQSGKSIVKTFSKPTMMFSKNSNTGKDI